MKKFFFIFLLLPVTGFCQLPSGNEEGTNVGNIAPEIVMNNPDDSSIALSSLRGKMVLIDFWASWCGPCRGENPNVVKAYKKFKDRVFVNGNGFTVFSVSLDKDKNAWKAAIAHDSLVWPYHVSDLQFWSNAAAQRYGIFQIPSNVLIDGNGIIIAKNLRGTALEEALQTQLEQDKKMIKEHEKKKKHSGKSSRGKKQKDKTTTGMAPMIHEENMGTRWL